MKNQTLQDVIERFEDGPLLPEEVSKKEYDNVIGYLITIGFIDMIYDIIAQAAVEEERKRIMMRLPRRHFGKGDMLISYNEVKNIINNTQ